MGRGLHLNDSGSCPSFSSTIAARGELRMFDIHSSSFPPDFFRGWSSIFKGVYMSTVCSSSFQLEFSFPVIFAAWDESDSNVSRDLSMHAA